MPRRRKKSSRSNRKPPLAFSESPLDVSRQFASPITGAMNPITADIVSLQDLPQAKWVSPQFDPTASTPVGRRRRGRRRKGIAEEVRTACSQNPNRKKDALADVESGGEDDNRASDQCNLDLEVDKVSTDMSGLVITDNIDRGDRTPCSKSSDKENEREGGGEGSVSFHADNSTIYGTGTDGSAMRLCSSLQGGVLGQTGTPTCIARTTGCMPGCGRRSDNSPSVVSGAPLGEVNGTKTQSVTCPACEGPCRPLASDTPVNEYNLRVSIRRRRGRLPKAAWEQLIKDVS